MSEKKLVDKAFRSLKKFIKASVEILYLFIVYLRVSECNELK